jgi:hypothetical protein
MATPTVSTPARWCRSSQAETDVSESRSGIFNLCYSEGVSRRWMPSRQLCASASAAAFWLVSFSASADRQGRRPQSHLILLAVSALSLDQPLIGQALSSDTVDETIKPRHGVVFDVPFIQAECKFIDVSVKMLRAGVMINADQAALENRENAFHPIRGHVIPNIFARTMVDRSVLEARTFDADIRASFVGVQDRTGFNMPIDSGLDRLFVGARNRHADSAFPLLEELPP